MTKRPRLKRTVTTYTVVAWEVVWEDVDAPSTPGELESAPPPKPAAPPSATPPTEPLEGDKLP